MNEECIIKYIDKNPYEFRKDIIAKCKEMEKEDIYEWLVIDEREIYRLIQENKELQKKIENMEKNMKKG